MSRKVVGVLLVLLLGGCSAREAPTEDVDKAAGLFFQRLAAAQYEKIYEDSSKIFKDQKTHTEIIDNLKKIAAVGKPQDFDRLSMGFSRMNDRRVAAPVYAISLDQVKGEMTLTFIDEGGEWKLLGFELKQKGGTAPQSS